MTRSSADANWVLLIKPVSALWVAWWPPTLPSSSSSPPSSPWSQTASSSYSWRLAKDHTFYKKNLAPFPFLCNLPVMFFWVIPTTMLHHHPFINHVIIRICNLTHIAWWWKSKHSPLSRPAAQHTCLAREYIVFNTMHQRKIYRGREDDSEGRLWGQKSHIKEDFFTALYYFLWQGNALSFCTLLHEDCAM